MVDDFEKTNLHNYLRWTREAMVSKLDGLSDYDVRRPLTATGTNLLGLVKHLAGWEARYLGAVFERPFSGPVVAWDSPQLAEEMWAAEHETRADILERYEQACAHADATIDALALDAPGTVPWWPRPNVTLFGVLVHLLAETNRHAGHADILREQLDGMISDCPVRAPEPDAAFWVAHCAELERVAKTHLTD